MTKMKIRKILNILFWVLLVVGIILILWKIFGNNPTDFSIIITFTLMLMLKMWSLSDELKEFKYDVKSSFGKIKRDVSEIKNLLNRNKK